MENSLEFGSPTLSRRKLLDFPTGATLATAAGMALYPAAKVFVPPAEKTGVGSAVLAKDKLGNQIPASQILVEPPSTRALVAGVAAEPTYLTVQTDRTLSDHGIVDKVHPSGMYFSLERASATVSASLSRFLLRARRYGVSRSGRSSPQASPRKCRGRQDFDDSLDGKGPTYWRAALVGLELRE